MSSQEQPHIMTEDQMSKLIAKINDSEDASPIAKKAIIWLIRRAYELNRGVALSFTGDLSSYNHKANRRTKFKKIGSEAAFGVHDMRSGCGSTHIGTYLRKNNIQFTLDSCSGTCGKGCAKPKKTGYTIWFTEKGYRDNVAKFYVVSTRNEARLLGLVD